MSNTKTVGPNFRPLNARRQTFHEITPEQYAASRRTRDAAPDVKDILAHAAEAMHNAAHAISPRDTVSPSISEHVANQFSFDDVVRAALAIGDRISALEAKRNAALLQQQPVAPQLQPQQSQRTTDARCACGKSPCECTSQPAPRAPYNDGRNPMLVERHPGILPPNNLTFAPSRPTRDQNQYGESGQVSRFDSREADRLAYSLPRGSAGCPTAKELNDEYRRHWARDNGQQTRQPGEANARGGMNEARSMALEQNFSQPNPFEQFGADTVRPSQGALNALHAALNKTKAAHEKEEIAQHYQNYIQGAQHDTDAAQRDLWRPRQPQVSPNMPSAKADTRDAPGWQGLWESNKSNIASGDPNKLAVGEKLDVGGGQTHTIAAGETLSGLAQQYGGGSDLGSKSLASERGGVSPTGGSYSSGGQYTGQTGGATESDTQGMGGMKGGPKTLLGGGGTTSSSSGSGSGDVPTPPVKPSEYGGAGGGETGMGGMKGGPTTLLGGGGEASGGNYSSNASLKTGEGWPAGSSSAYPTGGAPSGGAGEGLKPLASEGGSGGTTSDARPKGGRPRGRR